MTEAKVTVVIVNFHSQELTGRCIDSLIQHVRRSLSLVVVDNSHRPDTDRLESRFPHLAVLRPGKNLGFAGGCNIGIRYGLDQEATHILLLNPDTRTEADFIEPLIRALDRNPEFGMVGPRIVEDQVNGKNWFCGGQMNWWLGGPKHRLSESGQRDSGAVTPVSFLTGCALMIRARAIAEVGLLDEGYFLYFEDADYVQRFMKKGWRAGYVADSCIRHRPSSTIGFASPTYVYYFSRNRIRFMKRWARGRHFLVFMVYTILVKLPGAVLVFGLGQQRMDLVRAFFSGFVDGLKGIPDRGGQGWPVGRAVEKR